MTSTLRRLSAVVAVVVLSLLATSILFLGNQRQAHAAVVPPDLGTKIVCIVFSTIDSKGSPVNIFPDACRAQGGEVSQCSDGIDNDGDGLIDSADPGCHTDGNASNPNSYDPSRNDESVFVPQCKDGLDNDHDGLVDSADPGCHTDFNANNPASYNPNGNDESAHAAPTESAENTLALCSDGIDNDGNGLIDLADPACSAFKPSITVKNVVVNTGGGTATSSDFSINVSSPGVSESFPGNAAGTTVLLSVGAFSVSQSGGPSGYVMATAGCSGIMGVGSSTTCIITNTFTATSTTADVSLTKDVDITAPNPGDTVTYTLTVTNNGPNGVTGVMVTDLLPSGLTFVSSDGAYASSTGLWSVGALANTAHASLHIVAMVGSGTAGQTITNTASVTGNFSDPNTGNNSASSSITSIAPTNSGGGGGGGNGGGGSGGGGGGGDGGNGPLVTPSVSSSDGNGGPIAQENGGAVLGAATSSVYRPVEACDQYLTAFIRTGYANDPEQVRRLQYVLRDFEGAKISVNGIYDASTLAAVNTFQSTYAADILTPWGITKPTGFTYLTTRKKVNEIYCRNTKQFPLTQPQLQEIAHIRGLTQPSTSASSATGTSKVSASSKKGTTQGSAGATSEVATSTKTNPNPGALGNLFNYFKGFFTHQ
jgi:uncharacterized repeat protein (TIGR01451 family)